MFVQHATTVGLWPYLGSTASGTQAGKLAARVHLLGATAAMLSWTPPGPGRGAGKKGRRCKVSCKGQRQKQSFSLHLFLFFFLLVFCFSSVISTAHLDLNTQARINLAKLFGIFIHNAKPCAAQKAKNIKKYSILWCTKWLMAFSFIVLRNCHIWKTSIRNAHAVTEALTCTPKHEPQSLHHLWDYQPVLLVAGASKTLLQFGVAGHILPVAQIWNRAPTLCNFPWLSWKCKFNLSSLRDQEEGAERKPLMAVSLLQLPDCVPSELNSRQTGRFSFLPPCFVKNKIS